MEYIALSKNDRVSPRKVRLVAEAIKGLTPSDALTRLDFLAKSAASPIAKTIKSALANGKNADLKIKNILVNEGVKMKRRDTSHGARFGGGVITKKSSHIKVVLTDG